MSTAFHLEVTESGLATLIFDLPGKSANVFTLEAMEELSEIVDELSGRSDILCAILASAKKRIFIAGADVNAIAEVTDPAEAEQGSRRGQELFDRWEALPFPTIAAVRGACMGGGTEISLSCTYILISDRDDIRIGLPETKLGIVPGWGGCTKLPRKVGLMAALDIILAGKAVRSRKAFKIGLADALIPDASFPREVKKFADGIIAGKKPKARSSSLRAKLLEKNPLGRKIVFKQARKQVLKTTRGHYSAPLRALEVVKTALAHGHEAGLEAEARAIGELAVSPTAKNLIHLFHMMEAAKSGGFIEGGEPVEVNSAAVLGAGVMGGGIAQILADKLSLPVRMKDIGYDALAKGVQHAASLFRKQVKRRWLERPEAERRLALIRTSLDYSGFEKVDLVIEAIVEKLEVKQKVFAEIASIVPDHCVLASNTSSLSIDLIAQDTPNPERVVGMHFFNPVDRMPLVEVVVGNKTSPAAINTIIEVSRKLGKTPIVVKSGPGFLVNRLLAFTLAEAMWMLDEGHRMEDIDRAASRWGMPMGPCALTDEVGLDTAVHVSHIMSEAYPERLTYPGWMDKMVEDGRLGAKAQKGFYLYRKGHRTQPDPAVYNLLGITRKIDSPNPDRMSERLMLPMVNEAARCLEEEIVRSAADLDLALILGTGFPPFRGGLCRWADAQGGNKLALEMEQWTAKLGDRFLPGNAYRRVIEAGGFYELFPS
ncbi:MAG: enoyl-CoA hydratase/isomerase family protein [Acidobacteria bacterium]|nr:enoyl-CoA hydratase/isomerase family protein [Acidobacteriota bacterium]